MRKIIIINFCVILILILALEISARIYIKINYGTQNAGLKEKTLYLNYEPFVMFGPNWQHKFEEFNNEKDKNKYTVLIIGGSTAQGLKKNIVKKYIKNVTKKEIQVFNAAYGGYISTQELILVTRFANSLKPDLIININGANDILHSIRPKNISGTFFLNETYKKLLNKPYTSVFINILQNSQFYNALLRLNARNRNFDINDYSEHLKIYLSNIESMQLFSKSIGAEYINILQPHVLFKNIKNNKENEFKTFRYREKIIEKLYNQIKQNILENEKNYIYFFDSTNIFNDDPSHIFSDDVHFIDDRGYNILTSFISKKLNFLNIN